MLLLGLGAPAAWAATTSTTFSVIVQVPATCVISANPLTFATYAGLVSSASTTLSITCTDTTPYDVGLGPGTTAGATVTNRLMASAGATQLHYGIFQDTSHTLNWGQTIDSDTVPGIGNGAAQSLTVYGMIPAGQFVTPGSYSDTVTATVTY